MQKYSAISFLKRVKCIVSENLILYKHLYILYFLTVAFGVVFGVISGRNLCLSGVEYGVRNFLAEVVTGGGVLDAFYASITKFLLLAIGTLLAVLNWKMSPISFALVFLVAFKSFRDVGYLICVGGVSNIICAVLFYLIFSMIYLTVFSFLLINIIIHSKYRCCSSKQNYNILLLALIVFLICLIFVIIYNVILVLVLRLIIL